MLAQSGSVISISLISLDTGLSEVNFPPQVTCSFVEEQPRMHE